MLTINEYNQLEVTLKVHDDMEEGDIIQHRFDINDLKDALKEAGMVMVPVEPTEAMTVAGGVAWMLSHTSSMSRKSAADIYRAMLTASKEADDEG